MDPASSPRTRLERRVDTQSRHLAAAGRLGGTSRFRREAAQGHGSSRIMFPDRSDIASSRGLKWRKLSASVTGVDIFAPVSPAPDPDDVERRIDSPTGVSILCDESLHRQDRAHGRLLFPLLGRFRLGGSRQGRVRRSATPTIPSSRISAAARRARSRKRAQRSPVAVYLRNRNKLHFVRQHHPGWFAWTVFVSFLRTGEFLAVGSTRNFAAAIRGSRRRPARRKRAAAGGPRAGRRLNRNDARESARQSCSKP